MPTSRWARAVFARAQCLERLGRPTDARGAYETLARRFPAHALAAQARRRVIALADTGRPAVAPQALTLRKLSIADANPAATVTVNGRYLAARDSTGVAWRHDLVTGRGERLYPAGAELESERTWGGLLLSPDGQSAAYTWEDDQGRGELRVARTAAAGAPEVVIPAEGLQAIRPVAWTPNGRAVLVVTTDTDFGLRLQLVEIGGRRMDVVYDLGAVKPFFASVSPDGRHVLFDHAAGQGPRDVMRLDLASRRASTLVAHAGNDVMPVFLPDGRSFLFASDRLGPLSLWRQVFSDGGAPAEPTLVRRDIGRIWAMGMSSSGTFIHGLQTGLVDVHTVRLGDHGRVADEPRPMSSTFAGNNQAPDWSPDGTMLAYAATRGALVSGNGSRAIVIRDHATGHERLLYPDMLFLNAPRWSPDGTRLLVKGRSATTNRWGEFIVDARTGAMTPAVTAEALGDEGEIGPHQWVPGREAILIGRHGKGLMEVDLASGAETMLVPVAAGSSFFSAGRGVAYSPDGGMLAWSVHERKAGAPAESVLRVRNGDRTIREVLRVTMPDGLMLTAWAPDGRAVYVVWQFGARNGSKARAPELWRVPIDGGAPEPTGLAADGMRVAVHPDGRTIAYVTGFPTWEIWAMEGIAR